jgi:hypothetical protein
VRKNRKNVVSSNGGACIPPSITRATRPDYCCQSPKLRLECEEDPAGTPEPLPPPELFVNEDISKPENRTNLALFGLMLVPDIRTWLLKRLALPTDSIVYPPQNTAGGRPDFVVVGPDETVVSWIEVELGGANVSQLKQDRGQLSEPVKSVVGPKSAGGDVSLEEIAEVVNGPQFQDLDRQQTVHVGVFTALVKDVAGKTTLFAYVHPEDQIRARPIVRELANALGNTLRFGTPPITPGTAQISTITQKGWTLRVFSKAAAGGTVSLMRDQVSSKSEVRLPSRARLERCFPTAEDRVAAYVSPWNELGADLAALGERQSLAVAEKAVLDHLDRVAECVRALATVYGGEAITNQVQCRLLKALVGSAGGWAVHGDARLSR